MSIQSEENIVKLQITGDREKSTPEQHTIFIYNVPVDDAIGMEVFQRKEDFRGVELGLAQRELLALNVQHEITSAHVFHHKVYSGLCLEARVQP